MFKEIALSTEESYDIYKYDTTGFYIVTITDVTENDGSVRKDLVLFIKNFIVYNIVTSINRENEYIMKEILYNIINQEEKKALNEDFFLKTLAVLNDPQVVEKLI